MGERITCALIGLNVSAVSGLFADTALQEGESKALILLVALLAGAIIGSLFTLLTGVSRTEKLLGSFALLGAIIGGLVGLLCSIAIMILFGTVDWYIIAAPLGFLIGYVFCWLCERQERLNQLSKGKIS